MRHTPLARPWPGGDGSRGSPRQLRNLPGENMPPGNPSWHLPPPETPMVFQGKTPGELARQLKDQAQNGGKTLEEILEHVEKDGLVTGSWDPGDGRSKPPLSHAEFVAKMKEWVAKGAAVRLTVPELLSATSACAS